METKELWKIPAYPCGYIGTSHFIHKIDNVYLWFEYWNEEEKRGVAEITFISVCAYISSSEKFSMPIAGAFRALVECTDSEWFKGFFETNPQEAQRLNLRHFAIEVEDLGLYEIIATDFKIRDIKDGPI